MEGRDNKKDVSTFGERHLKQITADCNQDAEITQPLSRHGNQRPVQRGRQSREGEEMTDGERRSRREVVKVSEGTTGAASLSGLAGRKKAVRLNYTMFFAAWPLFDPFPSDGEQMEVRSRDRDSAISLFRSSITCSADCRRSVAE